MQMLIRACWPDNHRAPLLFWAGLSDHFSAEELIEAGLPDRSSAPIFVWARQPDGCGAEKVDKWHQLDHPLFCVLGCASRSL